MSAVTYADLSTGMKLEVLNNNDVVFSIANTWADYNAFVTAQHKSVLLVSTVDTIRVLANDEHCLVDDVVNGGKKIKDFTMSGLSFPKVHPLRITISIGTTTKYYKADVIVLGDMEIPVVQMAIISPSDPNTAIVTVWPNTKSLDVHSLKRIDLSTVSITARSIDEISTYVFPVSDDGQYNVPGLDFGATYTFFVEMTNTTGNKVVSAPDNVVSLYIVDTSAFPASKLSAPIKDGTVSVTVAPIEIPDVIGTPEQIVAQRPTKVTLVAAKVPANILDVANYLPADNEYTLTSVFQGASYFSYDTDKKATNFVGAKLDVVEMNGRTLKYKARFSYAANDGSYCALQSVSVDAVSEINDTVPSVVGLQLVGYEYSIEKDDKTVQSAIIGKWSCDNELIIAGSTTASSITLSAFNGIATSGLTTRPIVTTREPTITFVHDKKESPYYRIMKRGVYAKVGDFSWAAFTAAGTNLARAKLALSGADLKIDGKQWLAVAKASIKSEWNHGAVQYATIDMAACALPSVAIALGNDNKVYGTFTVSEVQAHLNFVAKGQFTDNVAASLNYSIIESTTGTKTAVTRDGEGKLVDLALELARGSKNYYSVMAEAKRGTELIGASAALPLPNLHIIPGANRALSGKYACDAGEIKSGELAHAAGVGASFAVDYDGRMSIDQNVSDFADDHLYSADYQMSGVQSYDNESSKWLDVAGATIASVTPRDVDGKVILNKACFRITGMTGLVKHRALLARQYKLIADNSVKIADKLPVYLEFTPTVRPNTPVFMATGSAGQVHVVFANGAADSKAVIDKGLRNDLLLQGADGKMAPTSNSSESEFDKTGLTGSFVYVAGARSYANPNTSNGLTLMDEVRVSSEASVRVLANIEAGVAALANVSVATVYLAEVKAADATDANPARPESYSTKFMCNAPASGVSAEVAVYYDEAGFDKDVSKTYQLTKDKDGKFSYAIEPDQLRQDLGLTTEKFMAASLKCLFTGYKEYSQTQGVSDLRRSVAVSATYTPNMKPTLVSSAFSVEKLQGQLKVTTGALSKVQLGGNASLNVKVIAKSAANTYGAGEIITLGMAGLSKTLTLAADLYTVSVVIQSGAYVGETTLALGTYRPDAALAAAKTFTVTAGSATSSLAAAWENLTSDQLGGWALSARSIFVSSVDAGTTKYYVASASAATTTATKTAFRSISISALTDTLSGLPIGKQLTVSLETTYTKSGESPQIDHMDVTATCAAAPIFQSFTLDKATNTVNALINQNGSTITSFWLFAKYDGAQGQIYFNIPVASLATMSNTGNHLFKIAMPTTGPKPSGVMGVIVNGYGAVTNGSPALTFGAPAGGSVQYNSQTDGKVELQLTLA